MFTDELLLCDGIVSDVADVAAESVGARAEGRCARFPSRCISHETSFESYVRPVEGWTVKGKLVRDLAAEGVFPIEEMA
jgi:hypothetical protein